MNKKLLLIPLGLFIVALLLRSLDIFVFHLDHRWGQRKQPLVQSCYWVFIPRFSNCYLGDFGTVGLVPLAKYTKNIGV